jgi:hypothetical protein
MTSSSPTGMSIQFRTLVFHSKSEEQIQEHLYLKKFMISLPVAIGAFDSPLRPYPESDLATDLYSTSTPIAIMDGSNRHISFNSFKEPMTSLSAVISALGSLLGPHP